MYASARDGHPAPAARAALHDRLARQRRRRRALRAEEGDLYLSLTIPSLIVATHGGGTGLPTQQECLRVLGCTGRGKAKKLAEIMAAVALAGELSLGAAISSLDWVSSHERLGRNR